MHTPEYIHIDVFRAYAIRPYNETDCIRFMKTIRILGIIVIVALIGNFIKDGISGFIDGWNDAEADSQLVLPADFNSVSLSVKGYKEGMSDSLFNQAMQANVPCEVNGVSTYVKHNSWVHAMGFVIFPCVLLVFYGVYCLIRLLIAVSRESGRDSDSEEHTPLAFLHLSDNGILRFVRTAGICPLPNRHERVGIFGLRVR